MKRRKFLGLTATTPLLLSPFARAAWAAARWDRTLVLVELNGGNDGLNTVVPYTDPNYYDLRPNIAIPRDQVLQLDEKRGLHPGFEPLMPLWKNREMAIIEGLGYPEPNLSHFRGIDIWNTASDSKETLVDGWVSRLFKRYPPPSDFTADGIILGRNAMGPLQGSKGRTVSLLKNVEKTLKQSSRVRRGPVRDGDDALAHILRKRAHLRDATDDIISRHIGDIDLGASFSTEVITPPGPSLGEQFEIAARLLASGVKTPLIKLFRIKFDTHADPPELHAELLSELAGAVSTFAEVMKAKGLWDKVLVMTYSEFGRRPKENFSLGTDHGTAAPHFLFGGRVKGGLYGEQPPLDDLDNGNLKHRLHFRSLYSSVVEEWWNLAPSFFEEKPLGVVG
ncbi:MAG: DUF1501 domain-containing protein [Rhodospirillales bacterium]|jgi:uncharacterized protein (DUF1501 family)|nr:DUF1501 domain-containing protein [Rhodospirillales bacterium]